MADYTQTLLSRLTPDKDHSHVTGLQSPFQQNLSNMLAGMPEPMRNRFNIYSGHRSVERQSQLWNDALRKYGSPEAARKWVAPPGRSKHNHGTAADLRYADDEVKQWVHANAKNYGLHFPMKHEPWHIEPIGGRAPVSPSSPASSYQAQSAVARATGGSDMAAPIGGAPIAGGPVPLVPPTGRKSKLGEALLAAAATAKPKSLGELLNSAGDLALGYTLTDKHDKENADYRSKLSQALSGASGTDGLAQTLLSSGDPEMMQQGVALKVAQAKPQAQIGRFRATKQGVFDSTTGQIIPGTEAKGTDNAEYGTTPVPYIGADGKTYYTQISKAGGRKDIDLPDGAKWATGVDKVDTGTGVQLLDKKTGAERGTIAKDVAGEKAALERGKEAGEAQSALPAAQTMTENALKVVDELRAHPGRETGTGLSSRLDPRNYFAGTDATDFAIKNRQAQGQSFMAAREALKGAGQVTDFEGKKGEEAIAALDTAQSDGAYRKALDDLERMMRASYDDLRRKAGMAGGAPVQASPMPAAPATPQAQGAPMKINSPEEFAALPSGSRFIAPDGTVRVKP